MTASSTPRRGWAADPRHLQAVCLCRQVGMTRGGIMAALGIEACVLDSAIRAARGLGLDVAPRTSPHGSIPVDDAALYARIRSEVEALIGGGADAAPAPSVAAPVPHGATMASLMARGMTEEQARAEARQHHARAAEREARGRQIARQMARGTAQQVQRRRVSGQAFQIGSHGQDQRR